MRRIYFDTVVYDARALNMCIEASAADNVLFGSDYPHNVGDMAGCLALVNDLPGDQATKIGGANAARIFHL
jgi:aminocarboxymuconate-semialdehyde decarboxylase